MDRDGGRLLARWEPLAKVVPHPGTRVPSVAWNPAALADHGISRSCRPPSRRRQSSGMGNTFLGAAQVRYASWNASALVHFSPATLSKRLLRLRAITYSDAVVAIQETHGDEPSVREVLQRANIRHHA
eukprot:4312195-Pyramimonas_sp.AAC.1